ncbi:MAG: rRNA maturation RNase YbeY [Leptospira sp.]|nr:rRNA maturation RNase YbeY [Leptospira sp.]
MERDLSLELLFSDLSKEPFLEESKVHKNLLTILIHTLPEFIIGVELNLLIVSDNEMKKINRERRGISKATDVLSFPLFQISPPIPYQMVGDIVISVDTLKRQALEIGHSEIDEFYRLLVHGVLHLLGYDHETNEEDAIVMRKKEDECLDLIFQFGHGA